MKNKTRTENTTMKVSEICRLLDMSKEAVKDLIRAENTPVKLYRGSIRVPKKFVFAWLENIYLGGAA